MAPDGAGQLLIELIEASKKDMGGMNPESGAEHHRFVAVNQYPVFQVITQAA